MIFPRSDFGYFKAMTVEPGDPNAGQALMLFTIGEEDEILDRREVERLRDLCDEALK